MADKENGLLEKALQAWADLNRDSLRRSGASEETIALGDAAVKAYVSGNILKGMELAGKGNAQGVVELHKAAFFAVVDAFTITPPAEKIPDFRNATLRERARYYD